jgi:hypothetical protein
MSAQHKHFSGGCLRGHSPLSQRTSTAKLISVIKSSRSISHKEAEPQDADGIQISCTLDYNVDLDVAVTREC